MDDTTKCLLGLKLIKEEEVKKLRKDLKPGEYQIDTFIRVHGKLTVNEPEDTTPTYSLVNKETFARILGHLGCTRENIANAMIKVAQEKVSGKEAPPSPEVLAAMEKGQLALEKMVSSLPKVKRSGKVLGHLSMDEVSFVQVVDKGEINQKKSA